MATEFRSSMPIELVGNEGVMKRVSAGQALKDAPTVSRFDHHEVLDACVHQGDRDAHACRAGSNDDDIVQGVLS